MQRYCAQTVSQSGRDDEYRGAKTASRSDALSNIQCIYDRNLCCDIVHDGKENAKDRTCLDLRRCLQ